MINLYTNSTIGSYTTGTVTCTKNSANVTGSGTTWSEIVNPGDILTLNDDKLYVIKTVNSNTSITLDKVFAESTVSNSAYRIFLNTAAHFPSDTAAKVERALEQLSDINEAAINNDRTVTAATKVNGKGLTSITGNIDLNPPTVNSNTGGAINFHYNQSANTTSSIVENASGQIRINGVLELNEKLSSATGRVIIANGKHLYLQQNGTNRQDILAYTNNDVNNRTGLIAFTADQAGNHLLGISAINIVNGSTKWATLDLRANADGSTYITAPTPATNDNSTKIATTAFVNNRLPYTIGSWTPVLAGGTTEGEFTHTAQFGRYTRIGNICMFYCKLSINGIVTQPSGTMHIKGLPYVSLNQNNCGAFIAVGSNSFRKIFGGSMQASSTKINLWANNTENPSYKDSAVWGTSSDKTGYKIYETTASLWFAGFYFIA